MKRNWYIASLLFGSALCLCAEIRDIALPAPQKTGGMPLMQALNQRQSSREFDSAKLSPEVLSNLLWAASGLNRTDGRRTSPTASNRQEIDIYVTTADGVYLYQPKEHRLQAVLSDDLRAKTGRQDFPGVAPVNLVYVADYARMSAGSADERILYSSADTGFIAQNVYLFCASQGMATVVRGLVDRPALAAAMRLRPDQHVVLAQTVGYPKK